MGNWEGSLEKVGFQLGIRGLKKQRGGGIRKNVLHFFIGRNSWAVSGNLAGLGCPGVIMERLARSGYKGPGAGACIFKHPTTYDPSSGSEQSAEASPLESASSCGFGPPRSPCLQSWGRLPLFSGRRQKAMAICSPPTNILGGKGCFFSTDAWQGTVVKIQRPSPSLPRAPLFKQQVMTVMLTAQPPKECS